MQGKSHPVRSRQRPKESDHGAASERRRQPRGDVDPMDWETKVLRRVERHVESLVPETDVLADTLIKAGWEEAPLLALRRRIVLLKPE